MISPVTGQVIPGMTDPQAAALIAFLNANNVATDESSKTGIPVIYPSSGTITTAGAITLTVALPAIYANAWIWLPADAIVGGLAGLYYCTFSSTTVGVIKTNYNAGTADFLPYVPAVAVTAVGSNAAYVTLLGADKILICVPIAAGTLGIKGQLRARTVATFTSTADDKILKHKFGTATLVSHTATTSTVATQETSVANRGVAAKQTVNGVNKVAAGLTSAVTWETQDTATALLYTVTAQLEAVSDNIVIESFCLEQL